MSDRSTAADAPASKRAVSATAPAARRRSGKPATRSADLLPSDARPSDVSPKLHVASSTLHGLGMFAGARLRADTVLGRLAGMPTYDDGTYVLWLNEELGLEVTNDFRFINHSKDPNCALTDIEVVTLRVIAMGEELTHDYGW